MTQGVDKMVSQPCHRKPREGQEGECEKRCSFLHCFETRPCCVAQASLKLIGALLLQPPDIGISACTSISGKKAI